MIISVRIKSSYGVDRIYPVCEKALTFAAIAGTKTLSTDDIKHIKALGYTVNVKTVHPQTL